MKPMIKICKPLLLAILLLLLLGACSARESQRAANSDYNLTLEPISTAVGQTTLMITVTDDTGQPINDATLSVKGDMSHAGMEPVLASAEAGTAGTYLVPFEWSMAGDWIITVEATLADGTVIAKQFDPLTVSGDMGMSTMPEGTMNEEEMPMSGELTVQNVWGRVSPADSTGAFYMTITNGTTTDEALLNVASDVCGAVEIHQMVDNNGVMEMHPLEGSRLPIPAGQTVQLQTGGTHVMCLNKTIPFNVGDEFMLTLTFENAGEKMVTAQIIEQ